jgi:hypothetical protein
MDKKIITICLVSPQLYQVYLFKSVRYFNSLASIKSKPITFHTSKKTLFEWFDKSDETILLYSLSCTHGSDVLLETTTKPTLWP